MKPSFASGSGHCVFSLLWCSQRLLQPVSASVVGPAKTFSGVFVFVFRLFSPSIYLLGWVHGARMMCPSYPIRWQDGMPQHCLLTPTLLHYDIVSVP